MIFSVSRTLWMLIPVLTILGCGGSGAKPTGSVSGKVAFNSEPVANMNVNFVSTEGNGAAATVKTESDGTFKLSTPIPTGHYKIFITSLPPGPPMVGAPPAKIELPKIPPEYMSQDSSTLSADVKAGSNSFSLVIK